VSTVESLRIKNLESVVYYVRDIERSRKFFTERLDFYENARSSAELEKAGRQQSVVLAAGDVQFVHCTPRGEGGRAWRYLRKHPDGVGTLVFEVEDIEHTFRTLDARGGTPISDVHRFEDDGGWLKTFSITTPFGDTTWRFTQRNGYTKLFPGFVPYEKPIGGLNTFQFREMDHVTTNFQTMAPALLWMKHVMGFEEFWNIEFHSNDVSGDGHGSGLKSIVMWDPHSGVRFANNEPKRPNFRQSQINLFAEDHRGDGVQHVAITTADIRETVRGLRTKNVEFMPTPPSYYDMLPGRLKQIGVGEIDEPIDELRDLQILVDGGKEHSYMLQIFLKDGAGTYGEREAGPFFLEIIQRKGDRGFGGGNFRALFDSIERQQRAERGS
jgi:4-hydroxyphenylpyruvate dioxygenase